MAKWKLLEDLLIKEQRGSIIHIHAINYIYTFFLNIIINSAAPPHWKGLGRVSRECKVVTVWSFFLIAPKK